MVIRNSHTAGAKSCFPLRQRDIMWSPPINGATLGYRSVAAMIGHDFGSPVAAYCAVIRPDVFRSVVLMSAPFAGPPQLPFNSAEELTPSVPPGPSSIFEDLARLDPPRKHY
jgi:pimeloyl-ACP methyl ester carboxylesterase